MYVPIDDHVKARDIVSDIQRRSLTLGVRGQRPVLDGELWKEIKAHDSDWVIDWEDGQRCLIVTLIKRDIWIDYDYLLKDHECIESAVTDRCYLDITINDHPVGQIVIGLYGKTAPRTANKFRALCTGECWLGKSGAPLHYKGAIFSQILPKFLCQFGDAIDGYGTSCESTYEGVFEDESSALRHSRAGLLSMANLSPEAKGSQFSITLGEAPQLDERHLVFGEVLEGYDVVLAIEDCGDPQHSGAALRKVVIVDCGVIGQ